MFHTEAFCKARGRAAANAGMQSVSRWWRRLLGSAELRCRVFLISQKHGLMEQAAHQAIVMQFILDLAATLQVDPKGCFRHFFAKVKVCVRRAEVFSSLGCVLV